MAYLLGIDTGGTFTDAVILDDERGAIVASAKSLTTRPDLSVGIGKAIDAVLGDSGVAARDIQMVSLSTTLATNALVEGQGARVAMIAIGFGAAELTRGGLDQALMDTPVIRVAGGHTHAGAPAAALDTDALETQLRALLPAMDEPRAGADARPVVAAVAIAAQFATRNPAHEIAAREAVHRILGLPTTCSHELSSQLNGPKRALTALLNARLVSMIARLIDACEGHIARRGITAPLMVVRGDGALISAAQVRERPIETILSGPAASVAGAAWLTGQRHALVSDIGGTTTDVCLLKDGQPSIDPRGALVGGHRTMVEAVAMRTFGLGGDSELHVLDGLDAGLRLGPRRVMPLSLAAQQYPDMVLPMLQNALDHPPAPDESWRLIVPLFHDLPSGLPPRQQALIARLAAGPIRLDRLIQSRLELPALSALIDLGYAIPTGVTPSDAAHGLGLQQTYDRDAALMGLTLMARKRGGDGNMLAPDATAMAARIIDTLSAQSVDCLMESALAEDDHPWQDAPAPLARHALMQRALARQPGLVSLSVRLGVPVIGLGASAPCYYPRIAETLGTQAIVPEHSGVANAVGAVVGQVSMRADGHITAPEQGVFIAHLPQGPARFTSADAAVQCLTEMLTQQAHARADAAGVVDPRMVTIRQDKTAEVEGQPLIIEIAISVTAQGRPRIARD